MPGAQLTHTSTNTLTHRAGSREARPPELGSTGAPFTTRFSALRAARHRSTEPMEPQTVSILDGKKPPSRLHFAWCVVGLIEKGGVGGQSQPAGARSDLAVGVGAAGCSTGASAVHLA